MREIKFRGKITDIDKWVFGDVVRHYENQRRFIACDQMAYEFIMYGINRLVSEYYFEVIPETIGQYTRLKDKNGVEIYEGDILRAFPNGTEYIGAVEYKEDEAQWFGAKDYLGYAVAYSGAEVIGNIHDNPELLEVAI